MKTCCEEGCDEPVYGTRAIRCWECHVKVSRARRSNMKYKSRKYHDRKARGVCVYCEGKTEPEHPTLCKEHSEIRKVYKRLKDHDKKREYDRKVREILIIAQRRIAELIDQEDYDYRDIRAVGTVLLQVKSPKMRSTLRTRARKVRDTTPA